MLNYTLGFISYALYVSLNMLHLVLDRNNACSEMEKQLISQMLTVCVDDSLTKCYVIHLTKELIYMENSKLLIRSNCNFPGLFDRLIK